MCSGCNHNQMNLWWWGIQQLQSFLWSFSFSHRKDFWDEIFCNMLLKIHFFFNTPPFCINFSWIIINFFKVYISYQILHFILKNYLNFKFYENILIFNALFYFFINYNFVLDVMYITPHLHVVRTLEFFRFYSIALLQKWGAIH